MSHKLMLQAGFMARLAPGVYATLPLLQRVIDKLTDIVDEELQRVGCQRTTMPNILPANLWLKSGRWHNAGKEMFRLQDRRGAHFCLGPTHEEAFTSIVAEESAHASVTLPLRLYQISTK
jgi:prolyl-tRNA synthetase